MCLVTKKGTLAQFFLLFIESKSHHTRKKKHKTSKLCYLQFGLNFDSCRDTIQRPRLRLSQRHGEEREASRQRRQGVEKKDAKSTNLTRSFPYHYYTSRERIKVCHGTKIQSRIKHVYEKWHFRGKRTSSALFYYMPVRTGSKICALISFLLFAFT